jgi:hypothetical protein
VRSLVVGRPETLAEVTYAVENARGTVAGSVGRVDNAFDALDLLDGEPSMLFLEVSGPADPQIAQVRTLMMRGARVVILAKEASPELRITAIKAGAREVLFAPWTPARVQARMAGASAGTGLLSGGTPVDFRAIVLPEETKEQIDGRVTSLLVEALVVEIGDKKVFRDSLLRVAIQVPAPHRLPVLIARAISDSTQGSVALRFVGLTEDEETLLQQVISSGKSSPFAASEPDNEDGSTRIVLMRPGDVNPADARNAIGRVIADLDASVLREAPSKWLGLTLPPLTDAERIAMVNGGPLAAVAVWRTRAHVIASILETSPELATAELPFEEWRQGLADARARIRADISQRMSEGDPAVLRETRDVQARLNAVSDRIDRLAREAGIEIANDTRPLESPQAGPATFDRAAPPPASAPRAESATAAAAKPGSWRLRTGLLVCVAIVSAAAMLWLNHATQARRTVDIGRTGVATRPIKEVAGVRVRTVFREPNRRVVVVDRTWYDRRYDASPAVALDAARVIAQELGLEGRVVFRDFSGRKLADTGDGLDVAPLSAETAASPAPTGAGSEPAEGAATPASTRPAPR